MGSPKNDVYIIQGEISLVVTAMRRSSRWSSHGHQTEDGDPLLSSFSQLKDVLNNIIELEEVEPNVFLSPFLEVIRSEDTTGPITGLALTSVNKFLSYGLIDPKCELAAPAIENIADAVTHARFVGTDPGSDEVVLMKILHVLRTLLLSPAGVLLTNESVCEIMQSCFRICFEMRLSELLRKSAEHTLMDMVQLLFSRLPQFKEDPKWSANMKKLKMRTGGVDPSRMGRRKKSPKPKPKKPKQPIPHSTAPLADPVTSDPQSGQKEAEGQSRGQDQVEVSGVPEGTDTVQVDNATQQVDSVTQQGLDYVHASRESIATTPVEGGTIIDITKGFQDASRLEEEAFEQSRRDDSQNEADDLGEQLRRDNSQTDLSAEYQSSSEHIHLSIPTDESMTRSASEPELSGGLEQLGLISETGEELESGPSSTDVTDSVSRDDFVNPRGVRFIPHQHAREGSGPLIPYGLPCVRELFRFLISLTNPLDRHNTDVMIHMGLSLLTVALESGADYVGQFNSLLFLVKDEMCRHLMLLLQSERLSLAAASLRVCFLLFESMRKHLKLQLEMYLTKLSELITSDSPRITYELREIALESIVQLWRIPGLVTELYLNYDCDLYCSNLFEDLTKLLSKNAFPVSGLFSTHLLSLDALLTVIDSIEQHCHSRILNSTKSAVPDRGEVEETKEISESVPVPETEVPSDKMVGPPSTGYNMSLRIGQAGRDTSPGDPGKVSKVKEGRKGPQIRPNRMKVTEQIPEVEELNALKHKKRVYQTGTDHFNNKPSKGITYLQEQGLLKDPLDPAQVVQFLKENPKLDKKMIGEYISNRKNPVILETFVKSFNFEELRIDEALRQYLESFRLPGEAPVISYLMEHFADHWHKSNNEPFANTDAAFTLAYAVIMLNVDQHNHNVKKQNIPMTVEEFKKNLKKTNGGEDFEGEMLEEIYNAIRNEEIVMPAEHTGLVRENYLWKVLLRRGGTKEGRFIHAPTGTFDHELFSLIWGPTVAALSFVFDKSMMDEAIIQKAISGFRKCAMISAHYGISDVFDNLVISLCKFTTLLSSVESPENIPISFGINMKAQLAARTVFGLAHRHGDILREGWKNILDCMLQLYRAKLLPKAMIEVEDFVNTSGKISILKEETQTVQRSESGVLSSFYQYFTMSESPAAKAPTPEEQEATKLAQNCIRDCHFEQLINDSKFLREESLQELVKALIFASQGPEAHNSMGTCYDEDAAVFFFEQLVKCVLQNRDRINPVWQAVRDHICNLVVNANEHTFMVERVVVGLLRISIRLLRREEIAPQVLSSLRILLMIKPNVIHCMSQQISYGLHELLRTNAANIHTSQDWYTLFILLEVVGAGANPPPLFQVCSGVGDVSDSLLEAGAQSDSELPSGSVTTEPGSDRGYGSDSELYDQARNHRQSTEFELKPVPDNGSWLLVDKDKEASQSQSPKPPPVPINQYSIELNEDLHYCDIKSLLKSSETLSFLVRDAAHVTPLNFESCVHAIRVFAEASLNGGHQRAQSPPPRHSKDKKPKHKYSRKELNRMRKSNSSPSNLNAQISDEESEAESMTAELHSLSIQLLDLMHTLHTRAARIFTSWAEEGQGEEDSEGIDAATGSLWTKCWCPLLQGIARLCCDARRQVRGQALTYLQRALLVHDLQTLSATEWEACFNKILFPLLTKLLENINTQDPSGMEETRMRASTLLCKVFLQHLSPLLSLSTFTALWLTILDFMDKYMHVDRSDLLTEAIPESLKNMLLVMDTAAIFQTGDGVESQLWKLTWDRIDTFLPHLKDELFKPREPEPTSCNIDRQGDSDSPVPSESTPMLQQPVTSKLEEGAKVEGTPAAKDPNDNMESSDPTSVVTGPLSADQQLPTASSYFLSTPLPSLSDTSTTNTASMAPSGGSPPVPLLLNPDIMKDDGNQSTGSHRPVQQPSERKPVILAGSAPIIYQVHDI